MSEADYTKVTHDLTLAVARVLAQQNPRMVFLYISGAGTDSTERGKTMWARVKGRTENELLREPFRAAYMLRPGIHSTDARCEIENAAIFRILCRTQLVVSGHSIGREKIRDYDRRPRTRDDHDRQGWRAETDPRKFRHRSHRPLSLKRFPLKYTSELPPPSRWVYHRCVSSVEAT